MLLPVQSGYIAKKASLHKQLVADGVTFSTYIDVQPLHPGVYYIQANTEKRKFIKL